MADAFEDIVKVIAPIATIVGAGASFLNHTANQPKMPKITFNTPTKQPTPAPTPVMPTPDDAASRAAALRVVAQRAAQHGQQSTNLYEKLG